MDRQPAVYDAVAEASSGASDYLILNNIVQYASRDTRIVIVVNVNDLYLSETARSDDVDLTLAISDGLEGDDGPWILDSGSRRHFVGDETCFDDGKILMA